MAKILAGTTYQQGTRMTSNLPGDYEVRDVREEVLVTEPFMYPLIQVTALDKEKIRYTANPNAKFEWIEGELITDVDLLDADFAGGANTGTITVDTPALWVKGMVGRFEETDEVFTVTADPTGATIPIIRQGSGNFSAVSTQSNIIILGSSYAENDDYPTPVSNYDQFRYGRTQIFQASTSMTDRMIASTKHGGTYGGDQEVQQLQRRMKEFKWRMENGGWWNEGPDTKSTANGQRTMTGGIFWQALNYDGDEQNFNVRIDEDRLDTILGGIKYGSPYKRYFAGNTQMQDIEAIIKKRFGFVNNAIDRYQVLKKAPGLKVLEYTVGNVTVEFIRCPQWVGKYQNWGFICDMDAIEMVSFVADDKGTRTFRLEEGIQANGKPREDKQYLADIGWSLVKSASSVVVRPA